VRALRGAITVERDEASLLHEATRTLLTELLARNALTHHAVISAFFTATEDLRSDFPARAARDLGWGNVPMLCGVEMAVPGAVGRCIRVLLHVELSEGHPAVQHAYLREAATLRPDLRDAG
jgi:chorismate mutase